MRNGAVAEGITEDAREEIAMKGDLFLVIKPAAPEGVDEAEDDAMATFEVGRKYERRNLLGMDAGMKQRARAEGRGHGA